MAAAYGINRNILECKDGSPDGPEAGERWY